MNEVNIITIIILFSAFAAGLVLGALYFIALWRTVKKLPDSTHPLRLMMGSFTLRIAVVLTALYFIMNDHWERLAMALIGFVLMKMFLTRKLGLNKAF